MAVLMIKRLRKSHFPEGRKKRSVLNTFTLSSGVLNGKRIILSSTKVVKAIATDTSSTLHSVRERIMASMGPKERANLPNQAEA